MDQSHLGYTSWADPPSNSLRAIKLKKVEVLPIAEMGVSVEGSESVWPGDQASPVLPEFDVFNMQTHYIDVFNKGKGDLNFSESADRNMDKCQQNKGTI